MGFVFTDELRSSYSTYGYAVFRRILPPALVEELRAMADTARTVARAKHGAQVQRYSAKSWEEYEDEDAIDPGPFEAMASLPAFRGALTELLSERHAPKMPLGILLEPGDRPYTLTWHRDHMSFLGEEPVLPVVHDLDLLNQINAALYDDSSFWVVPGSQNRLALPSERAAAEREPNGVIGTAEAESFASLTGNREGLEDESRMAAYRVVDALSDAEREYRGHAYCEGMPGAVCLSLAAGDVAIYRNSLWHSGTYTPYSRRATIHGIIDTDAFAAWRQTMYDGRMS
jgi:hypothetical protein